MTYLLDSNMWIAHFRQTSPAVTQRLSQHPASEIVLCSVVLAELLFGVERSGPVHHASNLALVTAQRQQYALLPFNDAAAEQCGKIRADLTARGLLIGGNDMMIAAIALANGCTLVTHNTAEFSRVPGLVIEDWQLP